MKEFKDQNRFMELLTPLKTKNLVNDLFSPVPNSESWKKIFNFLFLHFLILRIICMYFIFQFLDF